MIRVRTLDRIGVAFLFQLLDLSPNLLIMLFGLALLTVASGEQGCGAENENDDFEHCVSLVQRGRRRVLCRPRVSYGK